MMVFVEFLGWSINSCFVPPPKKIKDEFPAKNGWFSADLGKLLYRTWNDEDILGGWFSGFTRFMSAKRGEGLTKPLPWKLIPIGSMYGLCTYVWLIFAVSVCKCRWIDHTWILWEYVPQKTVVRRLLSFWNGHVLGDMLVFGGVHIIN